VAAFASYGHVAIHARDIGMRRANDPDIAAHAKQNDLALLSENGGFADIRRYPPQDYPGIAFETHDGSIAEKVAALRNLLNEPRVVQALRGRLAIVTATRIRLRPPL